MPKNLARRTTPSTELQQAQRARNDADLTIYDAEIRSYVRGELVRIQLDEVKSTFGYAAKGEMELYDELREEAGDSAVKQQLLASYLARANQTNHSTLGRAYG